MENYKLGLVEGKFADIIWENEPLASRKLVEICEERLSWKKSTTYTVLKKLCEKGIFQNKEGIVTAVVSREEYFARQSEQFVEETFDGSLPAFIAAFTSRKQLSEEEVKAINGMINAYQEDHKESSKER